MIRRLYNLLPAWARSLMPTLILVTLAIIAGGTDLLSTQVHDFIHTELKERVLALKPLVMDLLIALVCLNLAWYLSDPLKKAVGKAFEKGGATDRGKQLGMKAIMLVYWGLVIFSGMSMFASEFMGKAVLGFSVVGAALTFAMQGAANDFICGVLMQFTLRVREGDDLKVIGMEVEGKVKDVGYLSTLVESSDGILSVPNRKIWESALKVKKAPPSKLIIPSGVYTCRKDK